ncbi:hypothetical protein F2P56_019230 [Juglans regia]|uniref:ABC transporter F family member 4-like n=2 Tax=Juglans regia TaxID=51240 RepID=A0A2I4EA36_JUGRE|nr:ABC transporter F family member 4-like [Juglans regia]XP_018816264.1 ABC transporter F family member 4-like [Juglans regia]XP_035549088.1 ABC transporter F family member 4-like [Juglans regia]KAF5463308.1 hypothetical protein F2P56_019230 [Juglans regia]
MEAFGSFGLSDKNSTVRKKRSNTFRRPRNESQLPPDYRDISSLSSTPPSDNASKVSSDENNDYGSVPRKKDVNLNPCSSSVINNENGGGFGESDEASMNGSFRGSNKQKHSAVDSKRHSEGVLAPADWKGTSKVVHFGVVSAGLENDNKVKKVKLKVGGVTRTIHAKSVTDGASGVGFLSTKASRVSGAPRPKQKLITQDNSDDDNQSFTPDKRNHLRGVPRKDFPRYGFNVGEGDSSRNRIPEGNISTNQDDKYEPIRKSKRISKRRLVDEALSDGDDDDDEIRYLEKLKTSKATMDYSVEYEDYEEGGNGKQRKISRAVKSNVDGELDVDVDGHHPSRSGKEGKKTRFRRIFEDTDYVEEEDPISDGEANSNKKKTKTEFVDLLGDNKKEMTVTTRQRALQTGKDVSSSFGASLIEFPNGLPPAPPRKQKEKLSEVEQQLKRAEALQRRRMQVEKAARESEAEAIRKILGQDSSRKKREDKAKKRQEELAQEKAANSMVLASDSVRWVMGPSGTVVTFPDEMGLPTIFDSKPCSYPPPREKCAGPSCTNPYKYRDSKSKLPLCSLQCYKAINEKMQPLTAC